MSEHEPSLVLYSQAGAVVTITLNRPKALNALSPALIDELLAAIERVDRDPEVRCAIITGAGGTQRLTKALGPYRAMELILTGATISADEAHAAGLVNRVCPVQGLLDEARLLAETIAEKPPLAVQLAKEAVRYAAETTLREGLEIERRNFYLLFDTADQKEGMRAFAEKRKAKFKGQ